jgi:predicted NBD/HSP70 family sugar kinase
MDYFAGLDVSVTETSVCIVDDAGKIVREARVASEPEALLQALTNTLYASSELDWKLGRCRSGFTAFSPKRACR